MRIIAVTTLGLIAMATSASGQVQQNNPNAANQSMGISSQMRSVQQQKTTQGDIATMNNQRSQVSAPPPNIGSNTIGPVGGGTGIHR